LKKEISEHHIKLVNSEVEELLYDFQQNKKADSLSSHFFSIY